MKSSPQPQLRFLFLAASITAIALPAAKPSQAQQYSSCKGFDKVNLHTKIDCLEAIFSASPAHLTASSMAPGNGFAVGGVLEQDSHYVSPFAAPQRTTIAPGQSEPRQPDFGTASLPSLGSVWSADGKLAAVFSTNGSWLTTGTLTVMPKGYVSSTRTDHNRISVSCNRLGPLCTQKVLGLNFQAEHRSLQTISFYGLGPLSPKAKFVFHQNDTFGSFRAALPLLDWLSVDSGVEFRQPSLPASTATNSVSANFNNASAPGLTFQPGLAHLSLGVETNPVFHLSPKTDEQALNSTGPKMKPYLLFTLDNSFRYHWNVAEGAQAYSFQQAVVDSDENIQLGSITRRFVQVKEAKSAKLWYSILARACGDTGIDWTNDEHYVLKSRQLCRLGDLDLRSHIVASNTGTGSTVPFYLQPTIGGSDIDSRPSLRAYPNYRFRAPDAMFVQTDYSVPVHGAVGLLLFYDAGTVGQNFSSLSFAHFRQDGGTGVTYSTMGHVAAQGYLAWGAGHGPTFAYNFAKFF